MGYSIGKEWSLITSLRRKDTGEDVAQVFFDNFYELWSDNHRRLTLVVDPGRVKTGLSANSEMGRAFVAGDEYILSVLPGLLSLASETLDTQFDHAFRAFPEIRSPMAPQDWQITFENRVLSILFDRPIDIYSLSAHAVPITEENIAVDGHWDLDGDGRTAQFTIEGDAIPTRLAIHASRACFECPLEHTRSNVQSRGNRPNLRLVHGS